jgi:hypothetical protein
VTRWGAKLPLGADRKGHLRRACEIFSVIVSPLQHPPQTAINSAFFVLEQTVLGHSGGANPHH